MPLKHKIFPAQRLVLVRLRGRVTAKDVQPFMVAIWADEAYDKSYDQIIDLTEAQVDMAWSDIADITALLFQSPQASDGRFAIIASKPLEVALSYLFQANMSLKNDIAVFSTWEAVRDFLDLPLSMMEHLVHA